jgi:hypothetical protein
VRYERAVARRVLVPGERFEKAREYEDSPDNPKRTSCYKKGEIEVEPDRTAKSIGAVGTKGTYHNKFAGGMASPRYKKNTDT